MSVNARFGRFAATSRCETSRLADVGQLFARIEHLHVRGQIEREEFRERHRHAVEHFLQRAHRRADAILLDERDRAVRHARTLGELALRQTVHHAHSAQMGTDVDGHGETLVR